MRWEGLKTAQNSSLSKHNLELLVNQFNNATPEYISEPENISSKYFDIDEMHNSEIPNKYKSLSLFRINTYSY